MVYSLSLAHVHTHTHTHEDVLSKETAYCTTGVNITIVIRVYLYPFLTSAQFFVQAVLLSII